MYGILSNTPMSSMIGLPSTVSPAVLFFVLFSEAPALSLASD
jgi:hypothetical protein